MTGQAQLPIGVFDSGIGGLTVVRALHRRLPHEQILYFGDTARVPYGVKSVETINAFAAQITGFLIERRVKLLIVACNTMAAVAAETIRARSPVPVVDVIESGAAATPDATRNNRVGVIGTLATVASGAYESAIHRHVPATAVFSQACPLFVPLVEEGWLDHPATRLVAQEYLEPLLAQNIDCLVLGCTHYPLLRPLLQQVAGATVRLVDSAATVAAQAAQLLERNSLLNPGTAPPLHHYFVTDVPQRFQTVGERFLGQTLSQLEIVKW